MKRRTLTVFGVLCCIILFAIFIFKYKNGNFVGGLSPNEPKYQHIVGYIEPETALFGRDFEVCDENRIAQYYNPERASYSEGKNGLRKYILSNYKNKGYVDSGYLNIRFVINCRGEAGRYVIHENNLDLEPTEFDNDIVDQIFNLTRQLKKWNPVHHRGRKWDSYMYISYRIENGEIVEILP